MKYFILSLLGFFCLIFQSTFFEIFKIASVKPDLILIIVIFYALIYGPKQGAIVGLVLGLMEDIFLAKYIGLNALAKFIIGLLIGLLEKRMFKENILVPITVLFVGTLFYGGIYYILTNIIGYHIKFINILEIVFPMAIYNTFLGPLIYISLYKFKNINKFSSSI